MPSGFRRLIKFALTMAVFSLRILASETHDDFIVARQSPLLALNQATPKLIADQLGRLYFIDQVASALKVLDLGSGKVFPLANVQGTIADFAIDSDGNIWLAVMSGDAGKVLKMSSAPGDYTLAHLATPHVADIAGLVAPVALTADGGGNLYIADAKQRCVFKVSSDGGVPQVVVTSLVKPHRLMVDATGALYVQDTGLELILRYRQGGTKPFMTVKGAEDFSVDAAGNFYVADKIGVSLMNADGRLLARLPLCPYGADAVAVSPDGRLFASGEGGLFELPTSNTAVYDFGAVLLGRDSAVYLAVCNKLRSLPSSPLMIGLSGPNASEFGQRNQVLGSVRESGCLGNGLSSSQVCMITLTFSPGLTGARTAVLSIKAGKTEIIVPLSGTGMF